MNQLHIKFTPILTVVKIFSQNIGSISAAASAAITAGREPAAMELIAPSCVCVSQNVTDLRWDVLSSWIKTTGSTGSTFERTRSREVLYIRQVCEDG